MPLLHLLACAGHLHEEAGSLSAACVLRYLDAEVVATYFGKLVSKEGRLRPMSGMLPTLAALFGGMLGGALVQLGQYSAAASSAMANVQKNVLAAQEFRLTSAEGQIRAQLTL